MSAGAHTRGGRALAGIGLTQVAVARAAGVSQATVSAVLAGGQRPSRRRVVGAIAGLAGVASAAQVEAALLLADQGGGVMAYIAISEEVRHLVGDDGREGSDVLFEHASTAMAYAKEAQRAPGGLFLRRTSGDWARVVSAYIERATDAEMEEEDASRP